MKCSDIPTKFQYQQGPYGNYTVYVDSANAYSGNVSKTFNDDWAEVFDSICGVQLPGAPPSTCTFPTPPPTPAPVPPTPPPVVNYAILPYREPCQPPVNCAAWF